MFGDGVRDAVTIQHSSWKPATPALDGPHGPCFRRHHPIDQSPAEHTSPSFPPSSSLLGLHQQAVSPSPRAHGLVHRTSRSIAKVAIKVLIVFVFLAISILFPAFDSIMAFMGSALCFTICVVSLFRGTVLLIRPGLICSSLPLAFYLKLFKDEITPKKSWSPQPS